MHIEVILFQQKFTKNNKATFNSKIMENLQFIDPLLHGIVPESKPLNLSVKQMVCAGVGALLASAVLKKTGHAKASALGS